jgi:hypothetical protein
MIRSLEASLDRLIADQATDEDVRWVNRWILSGAFSFNETTLEKLQAMIKLYQQSDSNFPALTWIPGVVEDHLALDHPWLQRGDHHQPGHLEPRRYLNALKSQPTKYQGTSSGRLQLALEITAPENPLTARVMVNRIWYWLHGEGIVPTVDNFGRMGEPPTHPELLDALALEFLAKGWSTNDRINQNVETIKHPHANLPKHRSEQPLPSPRKLAAS